MDKKLFAFDIDGTLVGPDHKIKNSTKIALKELNAKGHEFVIATGRHWAMAESIVNQLHKRPMLIGSNGACIYDWNNKTLRTVADVPNNIFNVAIDMAKELEAIAFVHSEDKLNYLDFGDGEHTQLLKDKGIFERQKNAWNLVEDYEEEKETILSLNKFQVSIMATPEIIEKAFLDVPKWVKEEASIFITGGQFLDFSPKNMNKFVSVKEYAEQVGVKVENIYAFGDSMNDYDMIQQSGHGIAMGNARSSLKKVARHIIGHNDSDAISDFLRQQRIIK